MQVLSLSLSLSLSLIALYSIFYKSSFTLKLDFEKIEFQNRSMDQNSFKTGIYC